MSMSTILSSSIFSHNISKYLSLPDLTIVHNSCISTRNLIDKEGRFIYEKVCAHIQPHGVFKDAQGFSTYKEGKLHSYRDEPAMCVGKCTYWYKEGKIHRDNDQPAIIDMSEYRETIGKPWFRKSWYKEGKLHRVDDKPAIIDSNGTQCWHILGKLHREGDNPAVIYPRGDMSWYRNGNLYREDWFGNQSWFKEGFDRVKHREGDLPAFIGPDGSQKWYKDGKLHREGDLPAVIETNGEKCWYRFGKMHRDGNMPAIIKADGTKYWYVCGSVIYVRPTS